MTLKQLILTLTLMTPSFSYGGDLRCDGRGPGGRPMYFANRWHLIINRDDQSSKEDLLKTFSLIGKNGLFKAYTLGKESIYVLLFASSDQPSSPEADVAAAAERQEVLKALGAIPGNSVSCSPIARPTPATGVHN